MPLQDFRFASHNHRNTPAGEKYSEAKTEIRNYISFDTRIGTQLFSMTAELERYSGTDHAGYISDEKLDGEANNLKSSMKSYLDKENFYPPLDRNAANAIDRFLASYDQYLDHLVEFGKNALRENPTPEDRQEKYKRPRFLTGMS